MPSFISRVAVLCVLLCNLSLTHSTPLEYGSEEHHALLDERQVTAPEDCSTGIHMIIGPGKTAIGNGLSQSLINKVKAKYPGSNARTLHYDGSIHPIPEARPRYIRYVKTYSRSCPNTPVMLFGYSAGGIIMMDTLCGNSEGIGPKTEPVDPKFLQNMIAAIAYGEETWRARQSYDSIDPKICKKDAPQFARPDTAACDPSRLKIRSYCNSDDVLCCAKAVGPFSAHRAYPEDYDNDALAFVSLQYEAFRLLHPISSILKATPIDVAPLAVANGFGPLQ